MSVDPSPRAVVDTNLIVSAFLSRQGAPHALLLALYRGAFRLILSTPLREEDADVLARPALVRRYIIPEEGVAAFFRFLERRAQLVTPASALPLDVRDPLDAHVLATAIGGEADFLVSGDDDLLSLRGDARLGALRVVGVREFLGQLAPP